MNNRSWWVIGAAACAAGCSGGQFLLDPALSHSPELTVDGPLGFNAYECDPARNPAPIGLGEDRSASIHIGGLSGTATPLRRDLTTTKMFNETLLADYRTFLDDLRTTAQNLKDTPGASEQSDSAAITGIAKADEVLNAIKFVLALPESATETTGFGFAGQVDGRTIVAACRTTHSARVFAAFDGPDFALHCNWASPQTDTKGEWNVNATGSWSNYAFAGELKSSTGEVARFNSQNVKVLGVGAIRGFDWRTNDGGVAALSFWQRPGPRPPEMPAGKEPPYEPRAWLARSLDTKSGFRDGLFISMAISYLFPWPSECEAGRLRSRAMETAK